MWFFGKLMAIAVVFNSASADPDLLQDVCVADLTSGYMPHSLALVSLFFLLFNLDLFT